MKQLMERQAKLEAEQKAREAEIMEKEKKIKEDYAAKLE